MLFSEDGRKLDTYISSAVSENSTLHGPLHVCSWCWGLIVIFQLQKPPSHCEDKILTLLCPSKSYWISPEWGSRQILGDVKSPEKTTPALQGNYGRLASVSIKMSLSTQVVVQADS